MLADLKKELPIYWEFIKIVHLIPYVGLILYFAVRNKYNREDFDLDSLVDVQLTQSGKLRKELELTAGSLKENLEESSNSASLIAAKNKQIAPTRDNVDY